MCNQEFDDLGFNPGFSCFKVKDRFYRFGSYSPSTKFTLRQTRNESKYIKQAHHLSYLYQGGGDYRGIYDIGFKRGFMGV
jgi:hypothetical protein